MQELSKLKDYRVKYKRYYDIDFGNDFVIHHIDCDHSNNDIKNLLLLPTVLHSKYHFQKQIVENMSVPTRITGNGLNSQSYYLSCLQDFIETLKECNKWFDYKMFLDGCIPNIHNIKLEEQNGSI